MREDLFLVTPSKRRQMNLIDSIPKSEDRKLQELICENSLKSEFPYTSCVPLIFIFKNLNGFVAAQLLGLKLNLDLQINLFYFTT